eukprot:TRINITY_DN21959_c0_g1_i5.p1 TRINITY_DN21959_c0_g1~~TRINITY_DN21959_c0_g1_i5.p1  ORF type:complete len:411 (-),score=33.49 TRINITY_DN21959_c0_g1_i5:346-1455(-)
MVKAHQGAKSLFLQIIGMDRLDHSIKSNVEEGVINGEKIQSNVVGRKLFQTYYSNLVQDTGYGTTDPTLESKLSAYFYQENIPQMQQTEFPSAQSMGSNASQGRASQEDIQYDATYWQDTGFESLVGEDDRTEVYNTDVYPYRTIGQLEFYCQGAKSVCTGTLIGPKTVATSAHCIFRDGYYCENYQFFPGFQADGGAQKIGVSSSQQHIPEEFIQFPSKPYYDYGVIILDEEIGHEVGWMGIGYNCLTQSQDLYTAGYPFDEKTETQDKMYKAQCEAQTINACPCFVFPVGSCYLEEGYMMKHTCDTEGGQSGSPLWSFVNKPDFPQIRAIHSQGFRACEISQKTDCEEKNKAVAIGPQVYNFFINYI